MVEKNHSMSFWPIILQIPTPQIHLSTARSSNVCRANVIDVDHGKVRTDPSEEVVDMAAHLSFTSTVTWLVLDMPTQYLHSP